MAVLGHEILSLLEAFDRVALWIKENRRLLKKERVLQSLLDSDLSGFKGQLIPEEGFLALDLRYEGLVL